MLSKKHLSNTDLEDDQQQQIYQQLSQLDLKLKSKPTSRQTHNLQKGWQPAQNKKEHHLKNWGNGKSESILTTYIPHMEYFSEICNQDIDQDSLFDCHNNFLGEHKLKAKENTSPSNAIHIKYPKSNNEVDEDQCSFGQKNIKDSLDIPQNSQILKQKTYIYKKQSVRPSNSTKRLPIQKSTNRSNKKKSLLLQKSRERQTDLSYRQNKKPTKSKQKYNLKQNPIEQQIKIQQSDLVKFSTFESFLSKAIEANSQEKEKPSKKSKCNKDQQSQISLQCTFKPSILKKSSQMVKSTKNVVQRLSTCNQSKEKKPYNPQPPKPLPNKQRIEQLSQPRKLKTQGPQQVQQTPSFRPSLSKKSLQQMRNCRYDVATRNQLWLQQKNQKLQRIKEEQELQKNKKQGCTYSPAICQYKGENDPRFSRFGKQGIANYFQRLSGANKNMTKSKGQQSFQNKQNKTSSLNEQQKSNYVSKGGKKPNYEQAVKQLHNRIMGLKI